MSVALRRSVCGGKVRNNKGELMKEKRVKLTIKNCRFWPTKLCI